MNGIYTDDMTFWHPFLSVNGKQDMLGVARLWASLNKHLQVDTKRIGETVPFSSSCSWNKINCAKMSVAEAGPV